ncbi:MAG: peptidylprolyl isomerase [Proteobacteria bacterium]|nr:peptidylprolyl isomerase [Pseudomonadota bacterium]
MVSIRSRSLAATTLVMLAALALPAAAQSSAPLVTGENGAIVVTRADIEAAMERVPEASRAAVMARIDNLSRQAEQVYIRRVLAADALKSGLDKNPEVAAALAQARERILSDAQLGAIQQSVKLSDETLAAYARDVYRSNPKRFEAPAQTRARHILIGHSADGKAKERAADLLAKIKGGLPFEDAARKFSGDYASAAKGGDLGWFSAGTMVKPFEDAVGKLTKPGEIDPNLVETQFGFHIIQLVNRREAGIQPFEDVRETLENEVRAKAQNEARQTRVEAISRGAKVDVPGLEAMAAEYAKKTAAKP